MLLLCAAPVWAQDTPASPPPFVAEGDTYGKISIRDSVFEITQSTGFLRTRQVHSDFTLSAQLRLIDEKTEVAVGIRALTAGTLWPAAATRSRCRRRNRPEPSRAAGRPYRPS